MECFGDIRVNFVENATIKAKGNFKAESGISNSTVYIDGKLESKYVISSKLYVQSELHVEESLGKEGNQGVSIFMGINPFAEHSVARWTGRLEKLESREKDIKIQLKVLKQKRR